MGQYNYNKDPQGVAKICSIEADFGLRRIVEIIERKIEKKGVVKVFEPGCGGGRNLEYLKRKFGDLIEVYGLDISTKAIEYAKQNVRGNFVVAKTTERCFDEKFDVVIVLDILEHLPTIGAVGKTLELIKSVIVHDGVLFISCPIEQNKFSILWFFKKMHFWEDVTLKYYGHTLQFVGEDIMNLVKEYFTVENVDYGVHFVSQIDTFLFFYFPKQMLYLLGGQKAVTSFRESNITMDSTKNEDAFFRRFLLKVYSFVRKPFLLMGYFESRIRRKSKFAAMNMYLKCSLR